MTGMMGALWRILHRKGEPPITRQMLRLIGQDFTVDIRCAREELGYAPVISPSDAHLGRTDHASAVTHRLQVVGMVPPSITCSDPVMDEARSEARKAIRSATSFGAAGRPRGMPPREFMMTCTASS